jgi:hypothetical protein
MASPRENSVKQLSDFYNVVTGLALTIAITNLVDLAAPVLPVKQDLLINFATFLIMIIPFHQGAVRHLFSTYVENGGSSRIKRGALALDFLILFSEACIFVVLAAVISKTNLFTTTIIALLATDCIWGFLATLAFTGAQAQTAERKWALINLFTAVALVVLQVFGPPLTGGWNSEMKLVVFVVCFLRTILDYYLSWDFYYPLDGGVVAPERPDTVRNFRELR